MMKRIIICDSGLGGLNIASHFFDNKSKNSIPCEVIYFNAYPSLCGGFNKLAESEDQEELLRNVLEGMKKFSPDLCLIACNTLSIIYERLSKWYEPDFEVKGIIDTAVSEIYSALNSDPESELLIVGTKTTVDSGVYAGRLIAKNIAPERIHTLACPGLATLLESGVDSLEVRKRLADYAVQTEKLFLHKPARLILAFCCTHYEYARLLWIQSFSPVFGSNMIIVNPGNRLGIDYKAESFRYVSRIPFHPGAQDNISAYFSGTVPQITEALKTAVSDENLFEFDDQLFDKE